MKTLKNLKKQFDNYKVVDIQDKQGFIVFSNETYTSDEEKQLFSKYRKEECLKNFNVIEEPHSRYLYIEEIINNKNDICKNRKGILTYIMLNPSYARGEKSDKTMDKVRKWATTITNNKNIGYKYFAVLNLFAYRHHKPCELNKILQENKKIETNFITKNNADFIEKFLENNHNILKDFIIAYGSNKKYIENKEKLLKLLKQKSANLMTFYCSGDTYHISCRKKVYDTNHKLHLYPIKIY